MILDVINKLEEEGYKIWNHKRFHLEGGDVYNNIIFTEPKKDYGSQLSLFDNDTWQGLRVRQDDRHLYRKD